MIVLIDNYDSFTFNLVHYLGELGARREVHRNDKIAADAVVAADPDAIVLSPGPCTPNEAGICLDLIEKAAPTIPILGVCLGHQAIGQAFGGRRRARARAGARQALGGAPRGRPACSAASTAASRRRAIIRWWSTAQPPRRRSRSPPRPTTASSWGCSTPSTPVHGVQFHPESIASEHGHLILRNFLDIAAAWNEASGRRAAGARAALAH